MKTIPASQLKPGDELMDAGKLRTVVSVTVVGGVVRYVAKSRVHGDRCEVVATSKRVRVAVC